MSGAWPGGTPIWPTVVVDLHEFHRLMQKLARRGDDAKLDGRRIHGG